MQITANVGEFEKQLQQAADELREILVKVVTALVTELDRRVVEKTPVATGKTAMNWNVSRGEPGSEVDQNAMGSSETAVEAILEKIKTVSFDPPDAIFWLYNNLDHVDTLEFGGYEHDSEKVQGGFSIKAPNGMVRVSIEEVGNEAETIIRKALG